MDEISDELVMAYADGALAGEASARIEALLKDDAALNRRVQVFRATGAPLARLFQQPMLEPVPSNLVDFVMQGGEGAPSYTFADVTGIGAPRRRWTARFAGWRGGWQLAAASAALLVAGAGAGFLIRGGTFPASPGAGALVTFDAGRVLAEDGFARVLETAPSGHEVRIAGGASDAVTLRVSLTFKDKGHRYCREYEITAASAAYAGVACRTSAGRWAVEVNIRSAAAKADGAPSPAGGSEDAALDAFVGRTMDGYAFGKEAEDAALGRAWK